MSHLRVFLRCRPAPLAATQSPTAAIQSPRLAAMSLAGVAAKGGREKKVKRMVFCNALPFNLLQTNCDLLCTASRKRLGGWRGSS